MNLCIDVGNTTINLGYFSQNSLIKKIIFSTKKEESFSYYLDLLSELDYPVENLIYSSVVPLLDNSFKKAIKEKYHTANFYELEVIKRNDIKLNIDSPKELGADLYADLVGAINKYHNSFLVVDLGTATKFLYVDENSIFQSALIVPGLMLSLSSLSSNTDLLPLVDLSKPTNVLEGKNTIDCIRNGVILGHMKMIKGILDEFIKESKNPSLKVIVTGGDKDLFRPYLTESRYIFDDYLVLEGELLILNKLMEEKL